MAVRDGMAEGVALSWHDGRFGSLGRGDWEHGTR
jgi:hypothetical protein